MKLIERILAKDNVREALYRVVANKGAAGIDGMKVEDLRVYMNENWTGIKQSILERSYKPAPVRRVEIPKPNGGVRKLGIPTVVDRTIQQSIVQILTPIFEEEFQEKKLSFPDLLDYAWQGAAEIQRGGISHRAGVGMLSKSAIPCQNGRFSAWCGIHVAG